MLSRTAENLYWTARYLERAESIVRLLEVAYRIERKNEIKYTEGVTGSFELRQAQLQLYDLQNQHLSAMQDIIKSKTELDILYHSSSEIVKK